MGLRRTATRNTDEVANEFGQLVEEGRAMLDEILGEQPSKRAAQVRSALDDVTDRLSGYQSTATKAARKAARQGMRQSARYARQADEYLHENPWPAIAGGMLVAVLATLWFGQRR